MPVFDLIVKDLLQLMRDWKAAVFLVGMPIVFTLMFGFAFGGFGGQEDQRLPVGLLNHDQGQDLSAHLVDLLSASEVIRIEAQDTTSLTEMEQLVRDETWAAAIVIPASYSAGWLGSQAHPKLTVIVNHTSIAGTTAQREIQSTVVRLAGAAKVAQLSLEAYETQASFPSPGDRERFVLKALTHAIERWKDPPVQVVLNRSGAIPASEMTDASSGFIHSSPSMMVQFAIAGLIGAAEILVLERKSKSLRRLLTTTISRLEIIIGHFLAMFLMIIFQLVLLIAFGQLVLKVNYLREPMGILLVVVCTSLWTAGLGLLIGTLARSEEQVVIFSLIPMFVLSALGGAWMPLEFTSETFQAIAHFTPTAWSMDGFKNLIARGLGMESILLPCGVMLAYAIAFLLLGVWRFRTE